MGVRGSAPERQRWLSPRLAGAHFPSASADLGRRHGVHGTRRAPLGTACSWLLCLSSLCTRTPYRRTEDTPKETLAGRQGWSPSVSSVLFPPDVEIKTPLPERQPRAKPKRHLAKVVAADGPMAGLRQRCSALVAFLMGRGHGGGKSTWSFRMPRAPAPLPVFFLGRRRKARATPDKIRQSPLWPTPPKPRFLAPIVQSVISELWQRPPGCPRLRSAGIMLCFVRRSCRTELHVGGTTSAIHAAMRAMLEKATLVSSYLPVFSCALSPLVASTCWPFRDHIMLSLLAFRTMQVSGAFSFGTIGEKSKPNGQNPSSASHATPGWDGVIVLCTKLAPRRGRYCVPTDVMINLVSH